MGRPDFMGPDGSDPIQGDANSIYARLRLERAENHRLTVLLHQQDAHIAKLKEALKEALDGWERVWRNECPCIEGESPPARIAQLRALAVTPGDSIVLTLTPDEADAIGYLLDELDRGDPLKHHDNPSKAYEAAESVNRKLIKAVTR